ncbi:hypothetical protein KJ969_00040 [Patescibacteria group bacterium]|nr:hypothetical protein [Patescibacteria group bacterium]MBU1921872.1 hypothetical protein [Patescibacteria group bacterium]
MAKNKPELTWVNFLHIYQPPAQFPEILDRVARESYLELIALATRCKRFSFTLNINACLAEQLVERGHKKVIDGLLRLARRGQIEFTGSAAYHAILPLLPEHEIIHQIKKNDEINKRIFGAAYKPTGFFLPEMAYGARVAKIVRQLGFKWLILDEKQVRGKIDNQKKYIIRHAGLEVIFRERELSKSFPPQILFNRLQKAEQDMVAVSATDGELYGHWHQDYDKLLQRLLAKRQVKILKVSDFLFEREGKLSVEPFRSSWETLPQELVAGVPFRLWNDPRNKLHQALWQMANLVMKIVKKHERDPNYYWARWHLDRGLASCTFWWCSRTRPSPFCPITWNPDEIEKGLIQLIRAIRSLEGLPAKTKLLAEKKYFKLQKLIWQTHWREYGEK